MKKYIWIFITITAIAFLGLGIVVYNMKIGSVKNTLSDQQLNLYGRTDDQNMQSSSSASVSKVKTMKTYTKFPGELSKKELSNKKVVLETTKGKIEFEIYPEATKAASNFVTLTNDGYYDGLIFHRVVPGFVIQGGDPTGTGRGGPGYQFEDEPVTRKYDKGIVAMANSGPDTNGSQFFIMLENNPTLPPNYTIFGKVTVGQFVVSKIQVGDKMEKVTIEPLK